MSLHWEPGQPVNHGRSWSERERKSLAVSVASGAERTALAERFGRTREAIVRQIWSLGLGAKRAGLIRDWTPEEKAILLSCKTTSEAMVKLGRTRNSVVGQRWKLKTNYRKRSNA